MGRTGWSGRWDRSGARDPEFEFFSEDEGARFRAMVRTAFAEQGIETTLGGRQVRALDGTLFGLSSLTSVCRHDERGPAAWPEYIADHVRIVIRSLATLDAPERLTGERLRRQIRLQLSSAAANRDMTHFQSAVPVAPGLSMFYVIDFPESLTAAADEVLAAHGGAGALHQAALDNLRAEPIGYCDERTTDDGCRFVEIGGDWMFIGSKALILDEVLAQATGTAPGPDGILFAAPGRHQLYAHVVRDVSVVHAPTRLVQIATRAYLERPGPLSPDVYWWRDGAITRISQASNLYDPDKRGFEWTLPPEFVAVLQRLTGAQ